MLRVLQSLDRDKNPLNGIFIDDDTKSKLVGLSESKTKITENDIVDLKALMVKAGKELVVEKKARDYYKTKVLTPAGITPKFNPFTIEVDIKAEDLTFKFGVSTDVNYKDGYDYTVDWGDGKIEEGITTEKTHTYAKAGKYTIKVSGKFPVLSLSDTNKTKMVQVLAWGDIAWKSFFQAFTFVNTTFSTTDTPDLRDVTSMQSAFARSTISDVAFINDWDISKVTNISAMFFNAKQFNGNVSNWDVSNVEKMNSLFTGASSFNQDISSWTFSKINSMISMFENASNFNQNISDWDVSNVTTMSSMFNGATNFNQDLSKWDVSNATTMTNMFRDASSFNQNISGWKTLKVTNMSNMFRDASSFNQDLSGWNVDKVTLHLFFDSGWHADSISPTFPTTP